MSLRCVLATAFLVSLFVCSTPAAERLKSGLQPGQPIATIFEPVNVNGEHAGEPYCLICENGLSPVAMLFARTPSEPLYQLLTKLEQAVDKHGDQHLGAFVVFLNDEKGLPEKLAAEAQRRGLKRVILSVDAPAGPEGFHVAADAELTVVLYREHEVKANHAFRQGEFTAAQCEQVLADLPKIVSGK